MKKDIFFILLAALFLILSFPNTNLWIFAWFGFVPLFFALENKSKGKAFLLSSLTGIIFWSGTIYWLVHVTLPGTILLILYLALYFGLFGLFISNYQLRAMSYELIFVPSIWVILEYIRSYLFTGFPWALLGYSQYLNLPIIQIADITGCWGVSFLVMMVNLAIYSWLRRRQNYLFVLICILATLAYGYSRIYTIHNTQYSVRISVIQANIPQELKWNPENNGYILDKYAKLSEEAAKTKPDLIIWPEAASPAVLGEDMFVLREIVDFSKKIKIPLLIGAVTRDGDNYFNSALLLNNGEILHIYDKLHLVPFGEYIPLKGILPFLQTIVPIGDINAGKRYTIFSLKDLSAQELKSLRAHKEPKFSVLICFEDLFPELSRRFVRRGADFLVNITNDAWYKKTSAPFQHLQASVFRAVENRVFLARAANTGVSGFISPEGKIISLAQDKAGKKIFVDGFASQEIKIQRRRSAFYTFGNDFFIAACFLCVFYAIIAKFRKRNPG